MSFTSQQYIITGLKFLAACIVWPIYIVLIIVWAIIIEPCFLLIEKYKGE